jgi:RNA polymerase sigma-70 factor (ECF subfamily)
VDTSDLKYIHYFSGVNKGGSLKVIPVFMTKETNYNEAILVSSLVEDNLLAFNELYKHYCSRLYLFAYGYLKSAEEAEELVQEVFTIVWEKRKLLKSELSFKSFLFTIAFNIIRKRFRLNRYLSEYLSGKEENPVDDQTTSTIVYNSLYNFISTLIDQLPKKRKEIFIKSRLEGLSIKEISEQLNISHKTVENQLSVALKFMRSKLDEEMR